MNRGKGIIMRAAAAVIFIPAMLLWCVLMSSFFGQNIQSPVQSAAPAAAQESAAESVAEASPDDDTATYSEPPQEITSPEPGTPAEPVSQATAEIGTEIPEKYTAACPEEGTVQRLDYSLPVISSPGTSIERSAMVYLPFGYSAGIEYNTVYLLHGMGDDESSWFSTDSNLNVINNLIFYGDSEPVIIVCPSILYPDWLGFYQEYSNVNYNQFEYELRNVLIPLVESSFSCSTERTGRALAGLSMGSAITVNVGMERMLDMFSSFGTFSGSWATASDISAALHSPSFEEYSIDCLFATNGDEDFTQAEHTAVFKELEASDPKITEGENYSFVNIPYGNHGWPQWSVSLYDFLQLIFREAA